MRAAGIRKTLEKFSRAEKDFVAEFGREKVRNVLRYELVTNRTFYINLEMYEHPRTMIFVLSERRRWGNDEYYVNFEALSKWCGKREEKEKALKRRRREKEATAPPA